MVASWENYMDPSGGYRRNDYAEGTESFMVPIATETLAAFIFPRAEKLDLTQARASMQQTLRTNAGQRPGPGGAAVRGPHGGYMSAQAAYTQRYEGLRASGKARFNRTKAGITSKYAGLKKSARMIGWGYLALWGAEMGASALAPTAGLTASAQRNEAEAMGLPAPLETSQAYTQRQRALMAIHDSQLGIRNVIGSEAGHLHR
jgi:hypothetical protein